MRHETQRCIFCGAQPTTKEHVFPAWSHKHLPPRKKGKAGRLRVIQFSTHQEVSTHKLPGQLRDWQVKCVCGGTRKTCNGGWMKDLEDAVEPILSPLMRGDAVRVTPEQQSVIATWGVLKSIVSEYIEDGFITNHHMQRKYLMRRKSPPRNCAVWIGYCPKPDAETEYASHPFSLIPHRVLLKRKSGRDTRNLNSHATTQVLGQFLIHVVRCPDSRFVKEWHYYLPDGGSLFRIWPRTQTSIVWPGQGLSRADAKMVAHGMYMHVLRVVRKIIARGGTSSAP